MCVCVCLSVSLTLCACAVAICVCVCACMCATVPRLTLPSLGGGGTSNSRHRLTSEANFADTEVDELISMLRETENLEEQGDILQYLVDTQGLDFNTGKRAQTIAINNVSSILVMFCNVVHFYIFLLCSCVRPPPPTPPKWNAPRLCLGSIVNNNPQSTPKTN